MWRSWANEQIKTTAIHRKNGISCLSKLNTAKPYNSEKIMTSYSRGFVLY